MPPLPPAGPRPPDDDAPGYAGSARPDIQRAAEHLAAGRPADAADAFGRLVAAAPTYAAAHVLHAVALDAAGRPADALAAWHRAAFLVPRSPLVVRERTRLLAAAAQEDVEVAAEATTDVPEATPRASDVRPDAEPAPPERRADDPALPEGLASPDPIDPEPLDASPAWDRSGDEADGPEPPTDPLAAPPLDAPLPAGPPRATFYEEAFDGEEFDDLPALETLPLDDLAVSFRPSADDSDPHGFDPDGFDPDGFDFSAFDLGEDDAGWLTGQNDAVDLPDDTAEEDPLDTAWDGDDELLPDWAERLADESVTLISPEVPADVTEAPVEPPDAPESGWAVFEDEPAAPLPDPFGVAAPPAPSPPAAPPAAPAADSTPSVTDELDSLIASLEAAPRIRPDPAFSGPPAGATPAGMDEMVSETLAKIYAAQHQYVEAAVVYEKLAAREPARAEAMLAQAAAMRERRA